MPRKRFVLVDFSEYGEAELSDASHLIITMLTTNAGTFPLLPIPLATFTPVVTSYDTTRLAPVYPNQASDVAAIRETLESYLHDNGVYINQVGDGDMTILGKSGYPISKEAEPQGPLARTTVLVTPKIGAFEIKIAPDQVIEGHKTVPGARGYLVLLWDTAQGDNPPDDFTKWQWTFFPKATGNIPNLRRSAKYLLAATALGTNPELVFSYVIDATTQ